MSAFRVLIFSLAFWAASTVHGQGYVRPRAPVTYSGPSSYSGYGLRSGGYSTYNYGNGYRGYGVSTPNYGYYQDNAGNRGMYFGGSNSNYGYYRQYQAPRNNNPFGGFPTIGW